MWMWLSSKPPGKRPFAPAPTSPIFNRPPPVFAARRALNGMSGQIFSVPQPLLRHARLCTRSGIEMSLCCDIRLATDDARFGLPEPGLGIIPAAGGSQTLPRTIGQAAALEILLSGRWIDAKEALHLKLVNRILPRSELLRKRKNGPENTVL